MGCFDVACGVSGITIKHGDDALMLLLIPYTDYPGSIDLLKRTVQLDVGMQQVFNEGPLGMYMPFCLPIRGKYNDYGSLENIKPDETTKALTKYFGCPVEQLLGIIQRGKYGRLHDDEVTSVFGNDVKVSRYSSRGGVTKEWLVEAGFEERDGKFYHPKVPTVVKFDADVKGPIKTEDPMAYIVFKPKETGKGEDAHIMYWDVNASKYNERRAESDLSGFCNTFMENTKALGWSSNNYGVALGIDDAKLQKAVLATKLSGMFIDGKVYDKLTSKVRTNSYYEENDGILHGYMNMFLMDKMGFERAGMMNTKTLEKAPDVPGRPTYKHYDLHLFYKHPQAKDFLFSVPLTRGMATDMYKVGKDGKPVKIENYQPKKNKSYHPFSPSGLETMFRGEVGTPLDLSGLENVTPFDITIESIQDYYRRSTADEKRLKELKDKVWSDKEKTDAEKEDLMELFELGGSSDRDYDKQVLGYFNFPLVHQFYRKHFENPKEPFKHACKKFKNFSVSLWGINRPLMPSCHFGQHGEYMDQVNFNNLVKEALVEKFVKSNDDGIGPRHDFERMLVALYGQHVSYTPPGGKEVQYSSKNVVVAKWDLHDGYGYFV